MKKNKKRAKHKMVVKKKNKNTQTHTPINSSWEYTWRQDPPPPPPPPSETGERAGKKGFLMSPSKYTFCPSPTRSMARVTTRSPTPTVSRAGSCRREEAVSKRDMKGKRVSK